MMPPADKLKRIYFQEARDGKPLFVTENESLPMTLFAEAEDGSGYNISNPGLGTEYAVGSADLAMVTQENFQGKEQEMLHGKKPGRTTLRASYGDLETEVELRVLRDPVYADMPDNLPPPPPQPDRPVAVSPPDGTVVE